MKVWKILRGDDRQINMVEKGRMEGKRERSRGLRPWIVKQNQVGVTQMKRLKEDSKLGYKGW